MVTANRIQILRSLLFYFFTKYLRQYIYLLYMSEEQVKTKLPKIVTEVDDLGRKKFALKHDSGSEKQQEQQQKFIDTGRFTSTLVGRQLKIQTNKYIGKIEGTKKKKKTQVFYCEVCQVGFKCDLAYITHVNSPAHNRKLGMNMKVQAVSIEAVSEKLAKLAQEKNKSKEQKILEKKLGKNWKVQINIEPAEKKESQSKNKDEGNGFDQKNQAEEEEEEEENLDEIMMRSLGLPTSFGSKKKKY